MRKSINKALFDALMAMFNNSIHSADKGSESFDIPEKVYGNLNDFLDEIAVLYFDEEPDGTRQEELYEQLQKGDIAKWTNYQANENLMIWLQEINGYTYKD